MNDPDYLDPRLLNDPTFQELVLYEYEMLHPPPARQPREPRIRRERETSDDWPIRRLPPETRNIPRVVEALPQPKQDKQGGVGWLLLVFIIVVALGIGVTTIGTNVTSPKTRTSASHCPGYTVLCAPSISPDLINQVLSYYSSPAAGDGQELYNLGIQYGIDPVYPLAFYMNESTFGKAGMARVTLSLGNERCLPDRACVNTLGQPCQRGQSCYAQMLSWPDGFEHWYSLIKNLYVTGDINQDIGRKACPCITIPQIIPVYAPNSDGNNEAHYIWVVEHAVTVWRSGKVVVA